ncbi:MAG: TIGR03618 family F420-dependent PPOX class oxidoreductase [Dehalococcoidia bacterium]
MPSQRERIGMPDDEVTAMIERGRNLQVASIGRDGQPHLVPMWFVVDDGLITFTTYAKSQKVRNLRRDPRITVLLEEGTAYNEVRGVAIEGEAEVTDDPSYTARILARVGAKQSGRPEPPADFQPEITDAARKRCTVRVQPRRVRSWDHSRL